MLRSKLNKNKEMEKGGSTHRKNFKCDARKSFNEVWVGVTFCRGKSRVSPQVEKVFGGSRSEVKKTRGQTVKGNHHWENRRGGARQGVSRYQSKKTKSLLL